MASKIQVKRGNRADLPILSDGEFGLCQDTGEIFIGNGGSNIKIYPSTALTASNVTVDDAGGMFESTNAEGALAELAMAILEILSGAAIVGKAEDSNKVGGFTVAKNVPSNAVFTDTVTTINGKTGAISKADIVALGIPSQDTNTTYSEITTSEIDAGTASTLRTITGRRVKYILDKVQGWINALTKSDIGLGNIENYSIATQSEAESGTANNRYMTPLRTKQAINTHDIYESSHQDIRQLINDLNTNKVDNSRVLTDVPVNAKFTDTVYIHPDKHAISEVDGLQAALNGKVNTSQVLTNVPAGAVFTDTVTTINGKTGAITKADIVALGIPAQDTNTTYSDATTSAAGLMSAADKTKLDGIETGANNYTHPTTAGNKHIPTGGSSGQLLGYSASGTAKWVAPSTINAGQVDGKSVWVGAEGSKGTNANTIYFCY
jgi:hypothetical protein